MQIESQAVETARMLEQFEGSVAALREIERQYATLQVLLHDCMHEADRKVFLEAHRKLSITPGW